jgi:hypothetical protein
MPKYNRIQYGKLHKYGKYILTSKPGDGEFTLGEHTRYRIRFRSADGKVSNTVTLCADRISIPTGGQTQIRMRSNGGDWVRTQNESIQGDVPKVRMRSIQSDGDTSEWVYSDRANLKQI